jgi:hypothetical protein
MLGQVGMKSEKITAVRFGIAARLAHKPTGNKTG